MRRRRRPYYKPNHDRWLISYADYVTLLLALFVVLYAMSSVDMERLQGVVSGMRTAFVETGTEAGGIEREIPTPGGSLERETSEVRQSTSDVSYQNLRERIESTIEAHGETDDGIAGMQTRRSDRGIVISLSAKDFFEPGETRILNDALTPLKAIGSVLALSALPVRIEGHTDDTPIENPRFPSNWELSTARASAVARYLVEELSVAPNRVGASGYAEFRPVVPNDTPENRALNRRIDIVVLKEMDTAASAGSPGTTQTPSSLETLLDQLPPVSANSALTNGLRP